jgi:hypothetical protein
MWPPPKTTIIGVDKTPELEARFWAKVTKTDDCWLWTGRVNPSGMGQMRVSGARSRGAQGGTRIDVHRLSYLWFVGPIPPDKPEIDHLCRVPSCVRPDHLEAVTGAENNRRAKNWRTRDARRAELLARRNSYAAKRRTS